jgi:hypothetical protein
MLYAGDRGEAHIQGNQIKVISVYDDEDIEYYQITSGLKFMSQAEAEKAEREAAVAERTKEVGYENKRVANSTCVYMKGKQIMQYDGIEPITKNVFDLYWFFIVKKDNKFAIKGYNTTTGALEHLLPTENNSAILRGVKRLSGLLDKVLQTTTDEDTYDWYDSVSPVQNNPDEWIVRKSGQSFTYRINGVNEKNVTSVN